MLAGRVALAALLSPWLVCGCASTAELPAEYPPLEARPQELAPAVTEAGAGQNDATTAAPQGPQPQPAAPSSPSK